jgi:hypothetical protein
MDRFASRVPVAGEAGLGEAMPEPRVDFARIV